MRSTGRALAVAAGVVALGGAVAPVGASDGATIYRDEGCFVQGDYRSCWEAQTVSQLTVTPSGNRIYAFHGVNTWTYATVAGGVYGSSRGTFSLVERDTGVTGFHRVAVNRVRFGDLSCHTTLNVQVVDGEVRHWVDPGPCVPE
jgi:hypothetical protein